MRFFIADVGFEPVWMRRRRLTLHSRAPLPTALPKRPQRGSSNSTYVYFSLVFHKLCVFPQ